jgi:hypothetical protein
MQAGNRLAEMNMITHLYEQMNQKLTHISTPAKKSMILPKSSGSAFKINLLRQVDSNGTVTLKTSVQGLGVLRNINHLEQYLPKDLIQFILMKSDLSSVAHQSSIVCNTEVTVNDEIHYRCHFDYRSEGFWYDWGYVTFFSASNPDKWSSVPAKILCILPQGIPGNSEFQLVCHPCQWRYTRETNLITRWTKHISNPLINHGVPYEMVPIDCLGGHCLVVPDLVNNNTVYLIEEMNQWENYFYK